MKFFVTTIQIGFDGTTSQSIIRAEGVDEAAHDDARQKWHAELSYCRLAKTLLKDTCYITDENGSPYEYETWINPDWNPDPEPEVNEE